MKSSIHFSRVVPALVLVGLFIFAVGSLSQAAQARPAAQGVGWFNSNWTRRMPIFITNTGPTLTDYQVHISLAAPFEFSLAKSDGSDLRVTGADGTTPLPFWIESWGTSSASLYVKIPSLVGSDVTPTMYLYYHNPAATSASSGAATFDFFDGFETAAEMSGWTVSGSGTWLTSTTPLAKRGAYSGQLVQSSGTNMSVNKPLDNLTDFYQEWDLYDDLASPSFKVVRTGTGSVGAGVWTGTGSCDPGTCSTDHYVVHSDDYYYYETSAVRTLGWHKFGILIRSEGNVQYYVDGIEVNKYDWDVPNSSTHVNIVGLFEAPSTYNVDDIRIRKYANPEPEVTLDFPTAVGPNALAVGTFQAQSSGGAVSPLLWATLLALAGGVLWLARGQARRAG